MIKKFSNVTWLIVITIISSLVILFTDKVNLFALDSSNILQFQYLWTLITYMFVHLTIFHLFLSMLMLFSFGTLTERIIGKKKFLLFYLLSGIFAGLFTVIFNLLFTDTKIATIINSNSQVLGATGAIFAIAGLFIMLLPRLKFTIIFFPVFSLPSFIIVPVVLVIYWTVSLAVDIPTGNIAHLSGLLIGLGYGYYLKEKYKSKIQILHTSFSQMEKEDVARFPSEDPSPVLRIAKDGIILYSNDAGKLLLGKWRTDVGKPAPSYWAQLVSKSLKENTAKTVEVKDEDKVISFALVPVIVSDYVNLYGRDITALKNAQAKLRVRNVELVSLASHEMNTPLTSITALTEAVLKDKMGKITDKQKEALDIVFQDAQRLRTVIKNMVDASRIDEGVAVYEFKKFKIYTLIERSLKSVQIILEERGIKSKFVGDKSLIVNGDEARIEQVIVNLITNAMKYGKQNGHIVVSLKKYKDDVILAVKDEGGGIPKADRERIFAKDFKVQKRAKRVIGGLGYGLYISKKIMGAHKGKIWVESELGKGSTFYLLFPKNK